MGYYKRLSTYRAEVKRYNASRRKATQLTNAPASGLIRLETVSETERFSMAQDADRLTEMCIRDRHITRPLKSGKIVWPDNYEPE